MINAFHKVEWSLGSLDMNYWVIWTPSSPRWSAPQPRCCRWPWMEGWRCQPGTISSALTRMTRTERTWREGTIWCMMSNNCLSKKQWFCPDVYVAKHHIDRHEGGRLGRQLRDGHRKGGGAEARDSSRQNDGWGVLSGTQCLYCVIFPGFELLLEGLFKN